MPLHQDDPRLMLHKTDRVDWIALFLFKFQSPLVRFAINRHGTGTSLRLGWLKEVRKQTTKRFFELFDMHLPKKMLDRRLMGSDSLFKAERLFDLITLSCSPLGDGQF